MCPGHPRGIYGAREESAEIVTGHGESERPPPRLACHTESQVEPPGLAGGHQYPQRAPRPGGIGAPVAGDVLGGKRHVALQLEADHLPYVDRLRARQLEDLDHGEGAVQAEAETAALVAATVELCGDEGARVLVGVEGQALHRPAAGYHGQGGGSLIQEEAGAELHGSLGRHESTVALAPVAPAELSWA